MVTTLNLNGYSYASTSSQANITFMINIKTKDQLYKVANAMGRDRSYVLKQAIEAYLEIYGWQVEHIEAGQKQVRKGEFVPEQEWRSAFNRIR